MKQHRTTSLVAGFALLLGCAPMTLVYKGLFDWMVPITFTAALIIGASIGARALRLNAVLQVGAMFLAMLLACTWMYSNGGAILGLLPGPGTFENFGLLMGQAGDDIQKQTMPVESTDALVFLLVVGVGAMAILSEVFTSVMRIPALVGIPLLLLYLIPMALMPKQIPWMLFVPGAVGYLWLLLTDNIDRVRRYGRRFSGDGRGIDRWEPSPLASTGRWLAVLVVAAALVVPAVVPGLNSNMLAGLGTNGNGSGTNTTNGGKAVAPWAALEGGLEKTTPQKLGYVKTNEKSDPGYLKMWTANELTEKGFGPDQELGSESYPARDGITPEAPPEIESEDFEATFTSTGLADSALPLYGYPTQVDASDDWKYDMQTDIVSSASSTTEDLTVDFSYRKFQFTPDVLREAPELSTDSPDYRENTSRPEIKAVEELSAKLTKDEETQYDKVRAIFDHFSEKNGFSYTLETKAKQDVTDIEAFLDNKEGYCQQYAAAMGWLVREADIPARVSIGLTTGPSTNKGFQLTSDNFHAWVEVYFQDYGWVPFDPTPSSGVSGSTPSDWAPDPNAEDDNNNGDDNGDNGDSDSDNGGTDTDKPRPDAPGGEVAATELAGKAPPLIWPYWLAGGVVAAIVVLMPGISRALRRRRRLSIPESRPVQAAEAAWRELCDSLTDLRMPVDESETARTLARRLIAETGIDGAAAAGIKHLAAAQEHSRYAARPPSELTLRRASRAARFGLAATRSRYAQLRADLVPASLLSSWATGIRNGLSMVSNGMARMRQGLSRLVPKRRSTAPQ